MAWHRGGFEFPEYVSVATRRARARAAAEKLARKQKRRLAPVGPIEGHQARAHLLGQGVVRQPRVVRRLRKPPSARQELCPARSRHRSSDPRRQASPRLISGTSIYEVDVTIRSLPPKSWSRSRPSAPGRSTRSSICCAEASDAGHGDRHAQAAAACFPRRSRSPSSARARTGPGCASTSPPRSTASAFVWTTSPSCSSTFVAWTMRIWSAAPPPRSRA